MKINNKFLRILINLLVTFIVGAVSFYVMLPALNFKSQDIYVFIGGLCVVYIVSSLFTSGYKAEYGMRGYFREVFSHFKVTALIVAALILISLVGSFLSWDVIRAGSYRELIKVQEGDFAEEVSEISLDKIPMLDSQSATKLGDRKLGELSDMVSQFEVSGYYTQINYNGRPVRVTPLMYGDLIKWFNNRGGGIPAYLIIDMATQAVEVVRLPEDGGIKYSPFEHFGRNLYRHIRFNYPTFMFAEPKFEIDEDKTPYWVCPRVVKRIGLFGGTDIQGAVLVNAITGETKYYEEAPQWIDRVYPAELIVEQYDYYGKYINGFINSILGQKGVTKTTDGYNYIVLEDDVYLYTGVTSAGSDQSNVGFLLSNQRTKETKYYSASGATEYSAMASAQGVVQHLKYTATFPLLLNIASEPTYFMSLKDDAQLVKMYAMVNVKQYQIVATGTSVDECERNYIKLLKSNNLTEEIQVEEDEIKGIITEIRPVVMSGNTFYYFKLAESSKYYSINATENPLSVILNVGDSVKIQFEENENSEILNGILVERN